MWCVTKTTSKRGKQSIFAINLTFFKSNQLSRCMCIFFLLSFSVIKLLLKASLLINTNFLSHQHAYRIIIFCSLLLIQWNSKILSVGNFLCWHLVMLKNNNDRFDCHKMTDQLELTPSHGLKVSYKFPTLENANIRIVTLYNIHYFRIFICCMHLFKINNNFCFLAAS